MTPGTQTRRIQFGTGARAASKYRNQRTVVDGIAFPSKKEAVRYQQLKLLQSAGRIRNLERQVSFQLKVDDFKVCLYRADFVYEEYVGEEWSTVVEDCKGFPTSVYKLKKKLMKACLGIEIRET